MGAFNAQPGLIFTQDYMYDPRWSYGADGALRVISAIASEDIPCGILVQAVPGKPGQVCIARDGTSLVGVSCYDPNHYLSTVTYNAGDPIPLVRRGSVFCQFLALQPPFSAPGEYSAVYFYPGVGQGVFTTDKVGTILVPKICFGLANKDYYQTSDGSPAADDPNPIPPIPVGVQDTTFGDGVAMVEVNLG